MAVILIAKDNNYYWCVCFEWLIIIRLICCLVSETPPSVFSRNTPNFQNGTTPPALPERTHPKSNNDRMRPPLPDPSVSSSLPPNRRNPGNQDRQISNIEIIENLPGVHIDLSKNQVSVITLDVIMEMFWWWMDGLAVWVVQWDLHI